MLQEQFVDTLTSVTSSVTPAMEAQAADLVKELSIWELTMRGGFIMIPLALLSIVSIYIFVERCIAIHRAAADTYTMRPPRDAHSTHLPPRAEARSF